MWLPEKLQTAIEAIGRSDKPTLYSSNQFIYMDGVNKGDRHKEPQRIDLISHLTKNTIAGCTFVFNKALARLISNVEMPDRRILRYRLHDSWLMYVGIVCGTVIYDQNSYMLYRIHEDNVVGVKKKPFYKRLKRLQRYFVKRDDANLRMITAQELLRLYHNYISEKDLMVLGLYADYQKSWKQKRLLAFNNEIRANCLENPHLFALKVLTNFV